MNKIQKLSFQSVDDFLDYLPEAELKAVEELRTIIFECIPLAKEKIAYNVPFYSMNKNICYIWPSSIPWGKVPKDNIILGFPNGHLINDDFGVLETSNRKWVRTITLPIHQPIDIEMITYYLFEALSFDVQN